jgi:hypothetical protein
MVALRYLYRHYRDFKEASMSEEKRESMTRATLEYLASPRGRAQWAENHLAHGFGYAKNLVAAVQTANPRHRCVRYEELAEVMRAVEARRAGVAA